MWGVTISSSKKILFIVHNRTILTDAKNTFEKVFPNRTSLNHSSKTLMKEQMIFATPHSVLDAIKSNQL